MFAFDEDKLGPGRVSDTFLVIYYKLSNNRRLTMRKANKRMLKASIYAFPASPHFTTEQMVVIRKGQT